MASPTARSSAPRVPCPPGVDPVPGPQSPRHLSSDTQPGARPGLRAPQAPRRRPGPARDPHPRAGRGRAGEKPPPSAWPRRPIPAEVCRPFASKPTRCRRGRRPGAPLPRRRQTNNFHIGCGQRDNPIGASPSDRRSDPQGRRSCQTCFFHSWEFRLKLELYVIDTR